jgi:hypothetical protein
VAAEGRAGQVGSGPRLGQAPGAGHAAVNCVQRAAAGIACAARVVLSDATHPCTSFKDGLRHGQGAAIAEGLYRYRQGTREPLLGGARRAGTAGMPAVEVMLESTIATRDRPTHNPFHTYKCTTLGAPLRATRAMAPAASASMRTAGGTLAPGGTTGGTAGAACSCLMALCMRASGRTTQGMARVRRLLGLVIGWGSRGQSWHLGAPAPRLSDAKDGPTHLHPPPVPKGPVATAAAGATRATGTPAGATARGGLCWRAGTVMLGPGRTTGPMASALWPTLMEAGKATLSPWA